jgi:hypothetical protein
VPPSQLKEVDHPARSRKIKSPALGLAWQDGARRSSSSEGLDTRMIWVAL